MIVWLLGCDRLTVKAKGVVPALPSAAVTSLMLMLIAVTVIVTVATFERAKPSEAWYVKLSVPLKLLSGVYTKEPSGCSTSVPWLGPLTNTAVSGLPSTSVSLASTPGGGTTSGVACAVA